MPTFILRRSPEVAEYMLWSTVVDAPTSPVLGREGMQRWLERLGQKANQERFDRADATGSSAIPNFEKWGQELWWREKTTPGWDWDDGPDPASIFTHESLFDAVKNDPEYQ